MLRKEIMLLNPRGGRMVGEDDENDDEYHARDEPPFRFLPWKYIPTLTYLTSCT